jgi:hypothetical protein
VLFFYLAGHGIPEKFARRWRHVMNVAPPDAYPSDLAMFHQHKTGTVLQTGDIIGFSIWVQAIEFLNRFSLHGGSKLHLVLIIDACFSGHWAQMVREKMTEYCRGQDCSITIQAATNSPHMDNSSLLCGRICSA